MTEPMECRYEECTNEGKTRGLCRSHYGKMQQAKRLNEFPLIPKRLPSGERDLKEEARREEEAQFYRIINFSYTLREKSVLHNIIYHHEVAAKASVDGLP